jgi:hypothetical protein
MDQEEAKFAARGKIMQLRGFPKQWFFGPLPRG